MREFEKSIKERIKKIYRIDKLNNKERLYYKQLYLDTVGFTERVLKMVENYEDNKTSITKKLVTRAIILYVDFDKYTGNYKNGVKAKAFVNKKKDDIICSVVEDDADHIYFVGKNLYPLKEDKEQIRNNIENATSGDFSSCIKDYHSHQKGKLIFKRSDKDFKDNNVYFGLEIESYGKEQNAFEIEDYKDLFSAESDSSLPDESFELVSEPMTLAYIKENKKRIKDMLSILNENGQKCDRCGLHIHVSKCAFKDEQAQINAAKIVNLFKKEMEMFARRKEDEDYFRYSHIHNNNFLWLKTKDLYHDYSRERHEAVNLTNSKTVEFRIFKSSLDFDAVLASIMLVSNIIKAANKGGRISLKMLLKGKEISTYINKYGFVFKDKIIDLDKSNPKSDLSILNSFKDNLNIYTKKKWHYTVDYERKRLCFFNNVDTGRIVFSKDTVNELFNNGDKVSIAFDSFQEKPLTNKQILIKHLYRFSELNDTLKNSKNKKVVKRVYKSHSKLILVNR